MPKDPNSISDGELFSDLQQSMTDIFLIESLGGGTTGTLSNRLYKERTICDRIKSIIRERFTDEQIKRFLEKGYPKRVNLPIG